MREAEHASTHPTTGSALYQQAELHRLRGEFAKAEEGYRQASRWGRSPEPGLPLLRLAQGQVDTAAATMSRVLDEAHDPATRSRLLPAHVEIMLAAGERVEARDACREFEAVAQTFESTMLRAMVAHARGAVVLADGDAQRALVALRQAWQLWLELDAPYEIARTRVLMSQACRALGDEDAAMLELDDARAIFDELGAAPDLARLEALAASKAAAKPHGLSARELEVLRLVAAGKSNREIAAALVISEHTVARHVQNIFAKLRLSSRAAATAFAFEHDLV
jgi:DNA-binding NarL/FixJ family response regulator